MFEWTCSYLLKHFCSRADLETMADDYPVWEFPSSSNNPFLPALHYMGENQVLITWDLHTARRGFDPMHEWSMTINHRPIPGIHQGSPDDSIATLVKLPYWVQSFAEAKEVAIKIASKEFHVYLSWCNVPGSPNRRWVINMRPGDSIWIS